MSDEPRFTVLVSTDGGMNWRRHAGIIATATEQACKRVQEAHYEGNTDALFYATQAFRPRKLVERMVPKLGMQQVELADEPERGPIGAVGREGPSGEPTPHEPGSAA